MVILITYLLISNLYYIETILNNSRYYIWIQTKVEFSILSSTLFWKPHPSWSPICLYVSLIQASILHAIYGWLRTPIHFNWRPEYWEKTFDILKPGLHILVDMWDITLRNISGPYLFKDLPIYQWKRGYEM